MVTFLQPVHVPERCFLREVLLWVAFGRLPVAEYTIDGKEIRETVEIGDYEVDWVDGVLSDDETKRAGIPDDPTWTAILKDQSTLEVSKYDEWLARNDLEDDVRKKFEAEREGARAYAKACEEWESHYELAIEYPKSKIFVALRDGLLRARGRLLPALGRDEALSVLEATNRDLFDIPVTDIAPSFWTLQGIGFDASTATSSTHHYCHISCVTEEVISVLPNMKEQVAGIESIGDSFVLSERPKAGRSSAHRGRPPYPWDAFHIEVAGLLRRNELPEKKEAGIEHLRTWFKREHGVKASRSAIGEKLKPYYDKFIRTAGQKRR